MPVVTALRSRSANPKSCPHWGNYAPCPSASVRRHAAFPIPFGDSASDSEESSLAAWPRASPESLAGAKHLILFESKDQEVLRSRFAKLSPSSLSCSPSAADLLLPRVLAATSDTCATMNGRRALASTPTVGTGGNRSSIEAISCTRLRMAISGVR